MSKMYDALTRAREQDPSIPADAILPVVPEANLPDTEGRSNAGADGQPHGSPWSESPDPTPGAPDSRRWALPARTDPREIVTDYHRAPSREARVLGEPLSEASNGDEADSFISYWRVLSRSKGWVILSSFIGAVIGMLMVIPQTPLYPAHATLELQHLNENYLNLREVEPTAVNSWADSYVQTQVQILQSESLLKRVASVLQKKYQNYATPLPPSRLDAWKMALGIEAPKPSTMIDEELARVVGAFNVRASGLNRIVELNSESAYPQLAADFVNTLARTFIDENLEVRWSAVQRTGEWLTRQLEDLKIKLEKAEERLHSYAQATGLVFTGKDENVAEQKLKLLQEELSRAQSDRMNKQVRYEQAQRSAPESVPEILDDGVLRDYQLKLTELRRQLAELQSYLLPQHPKVQRIQAQIDELKTALFKDRGNILGRIKNDFEASQRRETLLQRAHADQAKLMGDQAMKAAHYNILRREAETSRQLYESMLQRMKEAGVVSAMRASPIRLVDTATPAERPYKPNVRQNALFGIFGGAIVGILIVFVRDRADRTLKKPGDAMTFINVQELGVIPSAKIDPARKSGARQARKSLSLSAHAGDSEQILPAVGDNRIAVITANEKTSLIAEAYRSTLTSIMFSDRATGPCHVVAFTSPNPREGKTTSVTNLGIAFAEINYRVLLVDGDLRRPCLHRIFGIAPSENGLASLLRSSEPIDEQTLSAAVQPTKVPGLHLLASGTQSGSTINFLYSPLLPEVIERLRSRFDIVLIDTPPLLQMFDARVLGRLTDGVILVFRSGRTTRDVALAAKRRALEDGIPVLGSILTDWHPSPITDPDGANHVREYKRYHDNT